MATKRISKRTREQAAMICAIAASSRFASYVEIQDLTGIGSKKSVALAKAAWTHVANAPCFWSVLDPIMDAEAEALIRTGWLP